MRNTCQQPQLRQEKWGHKAHDCHRNWRDQQVNAKDHNLPKQKSTSWNLCRNPCHGREIRTELVRRVRVDNSENTKFWRTHSWGGVNFGGFYLLDLHQVLTKKIGEKSPAATARGREDPPFWNSPEHSLLLNEVSPQEKLLTGLQPAGVLSQPSWPTQPSSHSWL